MNVIKEPSVNSSLPVIPMEKTFTVWHLNDKNSLTVNPGSPDRYVESQTVCIHAVKLVKDTGGYFHGGLND
jgi:hypothetical protein